MNSKLKLFCLILTFTQTGALSSSFAGEKRGEHPTPEDRPTKVMRTGELLCTDSLLDPTSNFEAIEVVSSESLPNDFPLTNDGDESEFEISSTEDLICA